VGVVRLVGLTLASLVTHSDDAVVVAAAAAATGMLTEAAEVALLPRAVAVGSVTTDRRLPAVRILDEAENDGPTTTNAHDVGAGAAASKQATAIFMMTTTMMMLVTPAHSP
jgi:hypothetical protein